MSTDEWRGLKTLVALLLAFQLVSVLLMWSLNPLSQRSQGSFALLLAADLVAFSIISYVNRLRNFAGVRGPFVLLGSAMVQLFMLLAMTQ